MTELNLRKDKLKEELLPILREKVFHVTSFSKFEEIQKSGVVRSNASGELGFTYPQSEDSYGRKRGYICLFDLRKKTDNEIREGLECFNFFGTPELDDKQVYLILDSKHYDRLIYTEHGC